MDELSSLQKELADRKRAQDEAREFLARAEGEVESLHAELAAGTRRSSASARRHPRPASAVGRARSTRRCSARSSSSTRSSSPPHSRACARSRPPCSTRRQAHALQRQVAVLEVQRPPSRAVRHSDELRRASIASHRPLAPSPAAAAFDGLSPELRHKRRVSLGMLKARIDSEVAASGLSSRAMSPAQRVSGLPTVSDHPQNPPRPLSASR
ncbi:hypothetical protein A0H81_01249 [Grifola frondosa]|uniref:Uncharacterized protein n=1 Tax=Grifola frondosa TaxID=5627 RepID=A0A1C7MR50_GRIFR|nr:hypothetical protein A0H81_01249 [Grifola frondosa]